MQNKIKLLTAGDSSILLQFGNTIDPAINRKIAATVQLMREQHINGVTDVIPAFCSLLINYDPRVISYEQIKRRMEALVKIDVTAGDTRKRVFEIPELKLLIDAVSAARFISQDKSDDLIKKLIALAGKSQRHELIRNVHGTGKMKADNRRLYYIVDTLNDAINQKKKSAA